MIDFHIFLGSYLLLFSVGRPLTSKDVLVALVDLFDVELVLMHLNQLVFVHFNLTNLL